MAENGSSPISTLSIAVQILIDVIVTFFVSLPVLALEFYRIFVPKCKEIKGKLVLVTGGGNGLGRAIALEMAQKGCNVAVADVNINAAEETAGELKKLGVKAKAYKVDVTKSEEILKLRDTLKTDLGPVDILVNNAGLMSNLNMEEKPENMEMMIKVNVLGTMLMTKFFLEQMKENQGGHIVSIASMSGLHPTPFSIPYSSTKYAVHGFMSALTEHLRLEKWRSKIKTTCVFPYYIKTRADVTDFLSPGIRFPALETDETAKEVVNGILREDFNVTIPNSQKSLIKLMNIWPLKVQENIRDRVLRERSFVRKDCKLNFDFK